VPEKNVVEHTPTPRTAESLAQDLRRMDLKEGGVLLVHSSLSALGWVCGNAAAVIHALRTALGHEGTLVMPAHSGSISDPSGWSNPPVPEGWWPTIREHMPVFDPETTPTHGMGAIAEQFRSYPGVRRSLHPCVSFTAQGPLADGITAGHRLDFSLGDGSPLAKLYELDAQVLLLGVGYDSCTCFHLAEYRIQYRNPYRGYAPTMREGQRQWTAYEDIVFRDELFPAVGEAMDRTGRVRLGLVGSGVCRLFSLCSGVDFARQWLEKHGTAGDSGVG